MSLPHWCPHRYDASTRDRSPGYFYTYVAKPDIYAYLIIFCTYVRILNINLRRNAVARGACTTTAWERGLQTKWRKWRRRHICRAEGEGFWRYGCPTTVVVTMVVWHKCYTTSTCHKHPCNASVKRNGHPWRVTKHNEKQISETYTKVHKAQKCTKFKSTQSTKVHINQEVTWRHSLGGDYFEQPTPEGRTARAGEKCMQKCPIEIP